MTITHPQAIISKAIATAIKPHAAALAAAVERDLELEKKMLSVHPDEMRKQGLALIDKASAGDDDALAELEKHGGLDGYVQNKSGMYQVYLGTCRNHAMNSAPLIEALAKDLIPAMEQAGATIQKQFSETMAALGELNPGLSEWDANIRNRCNGLRAMAKQAENGIGPAWLLSGLGLTDFLKN